MVQITDEQKIKDIEKILKNAKATNELTYITIEKIRRVIFPNANLKR